MGTIRERERQIKKKPSTDSEHSIVHRIQQWQKPIIVFMCHKWWLKNTAYVNI